MQKTEEYWYLDITPTMAYLRQTNGLMLAKIKDKDSHLLE
jgi:hypothetical protein